MGEALRRSVICGRYLAPRHTYAMHRLTVGADAGRFSGQPAVGATLVAVAVLAAAMQGQVPRSLAAGGRRAAR